MSKNRGFTLIELMISVAILSMVLASVFMLTSEGQKNAVKTMQSHMVNDEIQMTATQIVDDIKEANIIKDPATTAADHQPPLLNLNASTLEDAYKAAIQAQTLKTGDAKNKLVLIQCAPQKPSDAGATAKLIFKYTKIEYFLTADPSKPQRFALARKTEELDQLGNPVTSSVKIKTLIDDIDTPRDHFVFFRLTNSAGAISARSIYYGAQLSRKDPKSDDPNRMLYSAAFLNAGRIRGTVPDFIF